MAITYGLTDTGFNPMTTDVIRSQVEQNLRDEFFASLPLGDKTILGIIVGILAEREALGWENDQKIYNMMNPDGASGALLQVLCLLSGTIKQPATFSVVVETLCGTDSTVVGAGTSIKDDSTNTLWQTTTDCVLIAFPAWTVSTNYALGARVVVSTSVNLDCYQCVAAGLSASSGDGPSGETPNTPIVDNLATWNYIGQGGAGTDQDCQATVTGPVFSAAFQVTDITTPVGGLNTAINLADAEEGADIQSDQSLRLSREADLARAGTGTPPALDQAIADVDGVTSVTVFFNPTDTIDGNGLTPHSTRVLVLGGADQDIWDALWENVPIGIQTIGEQVGTVVDSAGVNQTLRFDRPTEVPIYVILDVTCDPNAFPADGVAEIQAAIVTYAQSVGTGINAVSRKIGSEAFSVDGVDDFPHCYIGTAPSPSSEATIVIDNESQFTISTINITVNVTFAAP